MSLYETLMTWPPERLAKELQGQARQNAALKRRVLELEVELFWLKVRDTVQHSPSSGILGPGTVGAPASTASIEATVVATGDFGDVAARPRTPEEAACWCSTCRPVTPFGDPDDNRMVLCPTCGNKRCPHATDHNLACSGSNEPGQTGSSYPARPLPKETPP